jgi:putative PIN family toxin of toxin-antitoxin system
LTDPKQLKVVFDTNIVMSALVFTGSHLAWLRAHWRERGTIPLVSHATVAELKWVLGYRKLKLSSEYQFELLSDYLSYCESIEVTEACPVQCRDAKDQPFLDLARSGKADVLVTGDENLLALAGQTAFVIETQEAFRRRLFGVEKRP